MFRQRLHKLIILLIAFTLLSGSVSTMMAQGGATARAISNLNVRNGPGTEYGVIAVIPAHTTINMEGRNRIGNWALISDGEGGVRGWVATRYLVWPNDVELGMIPVVSADGATGTGGGVITTGAAVEQPNAWPVQLMNLRQGTDTAYPSLGQIAAQAGLVLEARSADGVWALVHTADGQARGWIAAGFLQMSINVDFSTLAVSSEVVGQSPPPAAAPAGGETQPASTDREAELIAQLSAVPIVPVATTRSRQIYQRGRSLGNQRNVFAKVGDCNTESWAFMGLIGLGHYDLGPYTNLRATVEFFQTALPDGNTPYTHDSIAGRSGHTSILVIDSLFGDQTLCQPGESLLACEYRRIRPAIAFIMFGEADIHAMTAAQYETSMRQVIQMSIDRGVIPVVTTFPSDPADNSKWSTILEFNAILVRLAREYDVPLLNLWLAARSIPHSGIDQDLLHISYNPDEWIRFNGEENQYGFTMWNLIALQTLDNLRRSVLQ